MQFFRTFFTSRPVLILLLFFAGIAFLSLNPTIQKHKVFMSWDELWSRFPGWPEFSSVTETNSAPGQGFLYNPKGRDGRRALDRFFGRLNGKKPARPVRVLHYGDSVIFSEVEAGTVRSWMTNNFGNGGRGLIPVARYTRAYMLKGITQEFTGNWKTVRLGNKLSQPEKLGLTFRRYRAGSPFSRTTVTLLPGEEAETIGFLAPPGTPVRIRVTAAGRDASGQIPVWTKTVTNYTTRLLRIHAPQPVRSFTLTVPGRASLYGALAERKRGVVYSTVVRLGLSAHALASLEGKTFRGQLREYPPDLFIIQLGKNESNFLPYYRKHAAGLESFLKLVRQAVPDVSILLIGPAGRMTRRQGKMELLDTIPGLISIQSNLAFRYGCAFFDMYRALGRKAGMQKLVRRGLVLSDYMHFSEAGGRMAGRKIIRDLSAALREYRKRSGSSSGSLLSAFTKKQQSGMKQATSPVNFGTVSFMFFFLIIFFSYWLLYHYSMLRVFLLLAASYYFYMSWNPVFIILIILSTLVDYAAGFAIHAARMRGNRFTAKLLLATSIIVNLGLLFFFKYFNLLADAINQIGLVPGGVSFLSLVLPVGISFYTFQTMSYSLDIYAGRLHPVRSLPKFALFVSFFPQLVAGPIVRAREFLPQMESKRRFNEEQVLHGMFWIVVGLIKKVIIADYLAVNYVDRVFLQPEMYSGLENLAAVYAYGMQIFCDFSGYSDIAIGAAAMLGFRLPVNFLSPYRALNLQDFWHRWHITLSTWLRDYLYIPLGGNRLGNARTYINFFITMVLGGLWHGAAYRFILWGAWHGAGLGVVRWLQRGRKHRAPEAGALKKAFNWFLTFHFVMAGWVLFRAPNLDLAGRVFRRIGELSVYLPNVTSGIGIALIAGYFLHFLPDSWTPHLRQRLVRLPVPVLALLLVLIAVFFFHTAGGELVPFIYFQF